MLRLSAAVVFSLISDLGTKWQRHQTQDFQLEIWTKSSKYWQPLPQTIPNPKSFKQLLTPQPTNHNPTSASQPPLPSAVPPARHSWRCAPSPAAAGTAAARSRSPDLPL